MTDEDPRLLEVEKMAAPTLTAPRAAEIEQRARALFMAGRMGRATAPPRAANLANVLVVSVLCACTLGYLAWTAEALSALHWSPLDGIQAVKATR